MPHGVNDTLSQEAIDAVNDWYGLNGEPQPRAEPKPQPPAKPQPRAKPQPKPQPPAKPKQEPGPKQEEQKTKLERILPVLPLPMLGLAASYGVYFFAVQFVPTPIAIAEAAAFELTYIGLGALTGLSERERATAKRVSWGAVFVSVTYNTITAAVHQDPQILEELPAFFFWTVAILHGAPLAVLAYLVSELLLNRK